MTRYDDLPGVRRSDLWLINKSPEHFYYFTHNRPEPTPSLIFGQAAHKYILERDHFDEEFAIRPDVDRRTKAGKEVWYQFAMECNDNDITPISQEDLDTIKLMRSAIEEHPIASQLLLEGKNEKSWTWTDPMTGEPCKVRTDAIDEWNGDVWIVDYKTTDSCEPGHFERSVRKYGYKFQAGMYREGVFQNTFDSYRFAFVAQEKAAPYAVRVYTCSDEFLAEGYDKFRELIGIYHECNETGNWYGYGGPDCLCAELLGEG